MLRNAEGKIILLQTWWRAGLGYAAQALCRWQSAVTEIQTAPEVDGEVTIHRRFYTDEKYQEHEAFEAGTIIKVRFCLPHKLNLEAFRELLTVAGEYVGISPFGYRQDYGRFEVLDIQPYKRRRRRRRRGSSQHHTLREPDPGVPGLPSTAGTAPSVQEADTEGRRRGGR
jgi:hypothetical protein